MNQIHAPKNVFYCYLSQGSSAISSADLFADDHRSDMDLTASDLINRISFQVQKHLWHKCKYFSIPTKILKEDHSFGCLVFSGTTGHVLSEKHCWRNWKETWIICVNLNLRFSRPSPVRLRDQNISGGWEHFVWNSSGRWKTRLKLYIGFEEAGLAMLKISVFFLCLHVVHDEVRTALFNHLVCS